MYICVYIFIHTYLYIYAFTLAHSHTHFCSEAQSVCFANRWTVIINVYVFMSSIYLIYLYIHTYIYICINTRTFTHTLLFFFPEARSTCFANRRNVIINVCVFMSSIYLIYLCILSLSPRARGFPECVLCVCMCVCV